MKDMLSVIIPAFNEEAMVERTASVIRWILENAQIPHELIFVDDGSKDSTWAKIQQLSEAMPNVRGVHFSRNFGKESAITAGLAQSVGDCCAVLDCDLQHPPEKLVEMYALWKQGYEVIEGQKSSRGEESGLHALAAQLFYTLLSGATGVDMANASDFKLLDRRAVDAIVQLPERGAFFRALSSWVGFRTTAVQFDVREREAGESKWSVKSLTKYALNNITSFSNVPMQITTAIGAFLEVLFVGLSLFTLIHLLCGGAMDAASGIYLLILLIGGAILIALGVIGFYIGRIYDEIKGRPRYIIASTCGSTNPTDERTTP